MSSSRSQRPFTSLTWLPLGPMATALFVTYVASVVVSALPPRVLDPLWQLRQTASLVDNAPAALLGLGLVHLHAYLDPDDEAIQGYRDHISRFAVAAALGFVLLVPLQLLASLQILQTTAVAEARRVAAVNADYATFRQEMMAATSTRDLQARLQRLPSMRAPQLGPADLASPLEPLRQRLLASLRSSRAEALRKLTSTTPAARWSLLTSGARNVVASLALAAGFAAGARSRSAPLPLLDEIKTLLFRRGAGSAPHGKPSGRSAVVDEDYFSALAENDIDPEDPASPR